MNVGEIMTNDVQWCGLGTNLADAAKLMWDTDCGVLPVVNSEGQVLGMITDRDICMGTAMKDTNPSSISVEEVMSGKVYAATPDEDVEQALQTMKEHKVRRLPVVNPEGELAGILSMNDIVLKAKGSNGKAQINYADVVETYQAICQHPLPMTTAAAATT